MTRQRYFQMEIKLDFGGFKLTLGKLSLTKLARILVLCGFLSQELLQKILFKLIINDRGRSIRLLDFSGQLERDLEGALYWNVYLQTSALTTGKCIKKAVFKKLAVVQKESLISPIIIKISPLSKLQQNLRDNLFSIPDSEFYPGYFSRVTVNFLNLLETEPVKEAIADAPDTYRSIIEKEILKKQAVKDKKHER